MSNVFFKNERKIPSDDPFVNEVNNSLSNLKGSNQYLRKVIYFLRMSQKFYDEDKLAHANPNVIILGTSIPEEIIYAVGAKPFWVVGGSLGTYMWADNFVPRDTDAISQSILGFLKNNYFNLTKNATVVVPVTCDSMRKIAYILNNENINVVTVDIPPNKYSADSSEKYVSQMWRLCEKLQDITGCRLTMENFHSSVKIVNEARKEMRRFIDNCKHNTSVISGSMCMCILNSYYLCDDIYEWTHQLNALNSEIEDSGVRWKVSESNNPNVLLMGSPIYFPNYKIPFILESINLNIVSYVSPDSQKIYTNSEYYGRVASLWQYFSHVVLQNYYNDCSSAYVDNCTMFDNVLTRELEYNIDGVIYHVLKGQIEYDFELYRYEEFFNSKEIPVFRLETDYNYNDIEQIRIRVEAFSEMLVQNMHRNARIAK